MTSEQLVQTVIDANNEMTVKIALLVTLFVYIVGMYYFSRLNDNDRTHTIFFKVFFMRIPAITFLFFFPLYVGMLYQDVAASVLYGLIVGFYAVYTSLILVLFILWGADFMIGLAGGDMGNWKEFRKVYKRVIKR